MPTRSELIATGRTDAQIAQLIGADALIYQDLEALEASVRMCNPNISGFDASCFTGRYITGDVDDAYLDAIEQSRQQKSDKPSSASDDDEGGNAAQQIEMFVRRPGQE